MNSSNLAKPMNAKQWRKSKIRQRQREIQAARIIAAEVGHDEMRARLIEAQRNYGHGWGVVYPAVGIRANLKHKRR